MATINDVCKATGLSKATVSRVINGSGQVKAATRERVVAAMKQLNYHPSSVAQALATNISNSIGLILPQFQSNYFGSILYHAEQSAQTANKKLLVVNSKNSAQGETEAVETLIFQRCDAILLYSRHLSEEALVKLQQQANVPLIVLNRQLNSATVSSFGFEQIQLATIAVDHLIQLGHRNIACITSPLDSETGRLRYQAYQEALTKHDIAVNQHLVAQGENTLETGYRATQQLLQNLGHQTAHSCPFSALFACNDDMAIGAIRALHDAGLKVPHDISVIGIDNEPAAAYALPSLSSVSLPIHSLTIDAMNLAIKQIPTMNNKVATHKNYQGSLVSRESCTKFHSVNTSFATRM